MKNSVIIKHEQYGLRIRLDGGEQWESLLDEVRDKFASSANFFGSAVLTLTFDGRKLTEEQEDEIIGIIEDTTNIRILCVFTEDPERGDLFLRVGDAAAEYYLQQKAPARTPAAPQGPTAGNRRTIPGAEDGEEEAAAGADRYQILTHSLHSGDICRTGKTVIVLGDVEEGAALTTAKDAIVLGSVRGVIRAGEEHAQGKSYFIAASDLRPKKLSIAGVVLRTKNHRFSRAFPAVAAVKDGAVVMEPFDGNVDDLLRPEAQE